jgi:uncharacterized protein
MIIADTGFWLALANRNDLIHSRAKEVLHELHEPLICTWPVLTETCHLYAARLGVASMVSFVRGVAEGRCIVFQMTNAHLARCSSLMAKYKELPMDLADASVVVLAEELGHGRILSTDRRDFRAYRWKERKPFKNLLLPDSS